MADSVYIPGLAIRGSNLTATPRHSALVRSTHWISTLSFFGLLVSGFAILLAHPRLYWGETGGLGTPSLLDLPLPFMLGGPSGWGRYLHFLSAWVCVLNGLVYVTVGLLNQHFRKHLLPAKADLAWGPLRSQRNREEAALTYNVFQRLTYLVVIFVLFPLMIWTGLAMSPAIVSVFPALVTVLGGQQCARTIHFFVAGFLVLFLVVHIVRVWRAGFMNRVGAMMTGRMAAGEERS